MIQHQNVSKPKMYSVIISPSMIQSPQIIPQSYPSWVHIPDPPPASVHTAA